MRGGAYDKVFLATDDATALDAFQKEFKDDLLYYPDTIRSDSHTGAHCTDKEPLQYYRQGLEVLRDIYTLANCDSLVCCMSHVSTAARYINYSLDHCYRELVIMNNGINEEDSEEAKKTRAILNSSNKA